MEKVAIVIGVIVTVVVFAFAFALLLAFPTEIAWNHTVPTVFGLPKIGFWDAFCLNFLAGMFFKSSQTNNSKD